MGILTKGGDSRRAVALLTLAGFGFQGLAAVAEVPAARAVGTIASRPERSQAKAGEVTPGSPLSAFLNLTPDERAAASQQMQSAVQQALAGSTDLSGDGGTGGMSPEQVSIWQGLSVSQRKALLTNFQTRLAQAAGSQPGLAPPAGISPEVRSIMEGLQPDQRAALLQGLGTIMSGVLQDPAIQSFIAAARSGVDSTVSFRDANGQPIAGDVPVHVVPANPSGQFPAPSVRSASEQLGGANQDSSGESAPSTEAQRAMPAPEAPGPGQGSAGPAIHGQAIAQQQSGNGSLLSLVSALIPVIADSDADGLPDGLEKALADGFTPTYFVSSDDPDVFATFNNALGPDCDGDGYPNERVLTLYGLTPISYYRVTPQPELFGRNGMGYIRIDYLTLWNQDSGLAATTCSASLSLLGLNIQGLGSHCDDQEHTATLVAAPLVNGHYDTTAADYKAYQYYEAAHEFTFFDASVFLCLATPVPFGSSIEYWLSKSKHSTYYFNPNGRALFPGWVIAATLTAIWDLYINCLYNCDDDPDCELYCSAEYALYEAAAELVFYECVIEVFHGNLPGATAGLRINVGETNHVLNSCGFILANDILQKLTADYFSPSYSPCP